MRSSNERMRRAEAAEAPAAGDEAALSALADGALETLAGILRSTARHAFEIDRVDHEEFVAACEAWAQHVAIGTAVPQAHADAARGRRAWAELAAFYRDRRRSEQGFVNARLSAFKGIIWELVDGLRVLSQSGVSAEARIQDSLFQLERAVETGALDTIRSSLGRAVGDINAALQRRRDELDGRLSRMSSRLETLREDLLSARRAMELDALTQLYNRGAFDGALRRYLDLAALSSQPLVLMMIDLDHFKRINDEHGHPRGDEVIVAAARCLTRTFLRKNDFVARYGGEEFAAILPDTAAEHALPLAERLRLRMTELRVEDAPVAPQVTCSIGFAVFRAEDTPETLLARADAALYRAKAAGRNRVEHDS
jgi:diguanylate cyclase (GGDEF)-like protein